MAEPVLCTDDQVVVMRTGVFGGSFDPPHLGHMIVAENVRSSLALDRVLWTPAAISPHKLDANPASAGHRSRMINLAIADNAAFELCDIELERSGPSYTVDSLGQLTSTYPTDEFYLLLGMDSLAGFHTWKEPARILRLATIVAYPRAGVELPAKTYDAVIVDSPVIEISSTLVRRRVGAGQSIRYLVPEPVRRYIDEMRLYV